MVSPSGDMTGMRQKVCQLNVFYLCVFSLFLSYILPVFTHFMSYNYILLCIFLDSKLYNWLTQEISIPDELLRFVVVAERGGQRARDDKGDICFDDFYVEEGPCYNGKFKWL